MSGLYRVLASALLLFTLGGCGSNNSGSSTATPPIVAAGQRVVIVIFENQNYADVIGSSVMPFFNSVATANALGTQFYADTHPSIGNYFMLTTGDLVTSDDNFSGSWGGDNVVRQLVASGKSWKVYAESLPSAGYLGGDVPPYVKRHNPFAYFDDVINNSAQQASVVPFSQFAVDFANSALPTYSFVVPNNFNNGHDCPDGSTECPLSDRLAAIDRWFSSNFGSVIANTAFMNSTVLVVTFDESSDDNTHGGGRIPLIVAGSGIKSGYQSTTKYQFPDLLKFTLNSVGVTNIPGAGADASNMSEFRK